MGSTKWTYHKDWSFASNHFIFLKILFQFRTSCNDLIWYSNYSNVHAQKYEGSPREQSFESFENFSGDLRVLESECFERSRVFFSLCVSLSGCDLSLTIFSKEFQDLNTLQSFISFVHRIPHSEWDLTDSLAFPFNLSLFFTLRSLLRISPYSLSYFGETYHITFNDKSSIS